MTDLMATLSSSSTLANELLNKQVNEAQLLSQPPILQINYRGAGNDWTYPRAIIMTNVKRMDPVGGDPAQGTTLITFLDDSNITSDDPLNVLLLRILNGVAIS